MGKKFFKLKKFEKRIFEFEKEIFLKMIHQSLVVKVHQSLKVYMMRQVRS